MKLKRRKKVLLFLLRYSHRFEWLRRLFPWLYGWIVMRLWQFYFR